MDRQQLLDRVNHFAGPRYATGVTPRMLQDWVAEKLVPGPTAHGQQRGQSPYWDWSLPSYRRALQICRMKGRGAKRMTEIRVGLWMRGVDLPFDAVRAAIRSEFQRSKKPALRSVASTWDPRETPNLTLGRQAALRREMGEPSPLLLPAGYSLPIDGAPDLYAALRFGMDNKGSIGTFVADLICSVGLAGWMTPDFAEFIHAHQGMILGTMGVADEIAASAESSIQEARPETFVHVRDWVRVFPWMLQNVLALPSALPSGHAEAMKKLAGPFVQVAMLAQSGPWRTVIFVMCLHYAQQCDDKGLRFGQWARLVAPPLQTIIAQCRYNPKIQDLVGDQNPIAALALLPRPRGQLNKDERTIRHRLQKLLWPHGLADLTRFLAAPENRGLSL